MEAITAVGQLLTEVFKLANRELAQKYQKKQIKLMRELSDELAKPVYDGEVFSGLRDQAKIDNIERELLLIKDAVIKELNAS